MRDRFGARDPRSMMLRFHVQTAGSTLTAQQPDVNIVRTALQALAAVLGGAQSLHTNSRDEALALPTEESARIALRTQQIIAHESGVTNTVDPVGGSEHIEAVTDSIEQGVLDYLKRIDGAGGTLARHRDGLHPERNPECRLRLPAGDRGRQAHHCGGESLPARGQPRFADIPSRSRPRARSGGAATRGTRIPKPVHRGRAPGTSGGSRPRHGQPDALDLRCRRCPCHGRRNFRPPAAGLRRVPRALVLQRKWGGHSSPRRLFRRLDRLESRSAAKIDRPTVSRTEGRNRGYSLLPRR